MKKIQAKVMAWGQGSWTWSRGSSAACRSDQKRANTRIAPEPAFGFRSPSSTSCTEFDRSKYTYPQTRPIAVRSHGVVTFPVLRAPRREGEGSGSLGSVTRALKDVQVLVVEDDFIVAFDMQMLLEDQGAHVVGPAASLAQARSLLAMNNPQMAVLDVNLNGELVFPLVEELQKRDIPCIFATAYADDERLFPVSAQRVPRLAKPVLPNVLIGQIAKLLR